MKASKKITDLAEKLKRYREKSNLVKTLKAQNNALTEKNINLKEANEKLSLKAVDKIKLLEHIGKLEEEKRKLKLELENSKNEFEFLVTTPNHATVYAEIKNLLKSAKKEILICSPWITYLAEEFSGLSKRNAKVKVISRLTKEDVKKGITDLDKFRVLKEKGAEIRYNNNLHAKLVIVDSSTAIISSANLTKRGLRGLDVNYEAGILLKNSMDVKKTKEFFEEIWNKSKNLDDSAIKKIQKKERKNNG